MSFLVLACADSHMGTYFLHLNSSKHKLNLAISVFLVGFLGYRTSKFRIGAGLLSLLNALEVAENI